MKYIRTKDGIFEVDFVDISTYYHTTGWNIVKKEEIIAQADTIEELCDEFVRTVNGSYRTIGQSFSYLKSIKIYNNDGLEIYGAIWTEWGLKYVAKINKEGKLELI